MRQLGRYRLNRVLGSGAFATVWQGYDPQLDTVVAIKVLADNWAVDADVRERFLAEARLLRRIESPRVVRVHDVGIEPFDQEPIQPLAGDAPTHARAGDAPTHALVRQGSAAAGQQAESWLKPSDRATDRPYFVMDYISGGTLADRVGRLSPWQAIYFASEAAEAVQVLHDAGVLHRDIKPSNFLLDSTGDRTRVLVADLGSAKMIADASQITVTTGTPAYMAPEQAGRAGGFDGRADVYALAVVSYELLAGRRPFDDLSATSLILREPDVVPETLTETGLPGRIDTILTASLNPDPDGRPTDPHTFAQALVAAADHGQETSRTPQQRMASGSRGGNRRTWPLPVVLAIAVTVFLLAALVTWLLVAVPTSVGQFGRNSLAACSAWVSHSR